MRRYWNSIKRHGHLAPPSTIAHHCNTLQHTNTHCHTFHFAITVLPLCYHCAITVLSLWYHCAITATHCNTLQHTLHQTAAHCNTQHTQTQSNTSNLQIRTQVHTTTTSRISTKKNSIMNINTLDSDNNVKSNNQQQQQEPTDKLALLISCLFDPIVI